MAIRSLYGALILLIFTAPLSALLCGNCAPDRCPMGMSSEPSDELAAGHCQKVKEKAGGAETAPAETAACHGLSSVVADSDCCAITSAVDPGEAATAAVSTSFAFVLELAVAIETPVAALGPIERQQRRPLRLAPQPLYTLHSAFLI